MIQKKRNKTQTNPIYVYKIKDGSETVVYYKNFSGGIPDIEGWKDMLPECDFEGKDVTCITDKGVYSEFITEKLKSLGIKYIMPLKNNSDYIKYNIPTSHENYDGVFLYNSRPILFKEPKNIDSDDRFIIFLDLELYLSHTKKLVTSTVSRDTKKNSTIMETVDHLKIDPEIIKKLRKEDDRGVICLRLEKEKGQTDEDAQNTNQDSKNELNANQIYHIWKKRPHIEGFFDLYDNTLNFATSYMQDDLASEGLSFLNFLSAKIGNEIINQIKDQGHINDVSFNDVKQVLKYINVSYYNNTWHISPIKQQTIDFLEKCGIDRSIFTSMLKNYMDVYMKK